VDIGEPLTTMDNTSIFSNVDGENQEGNESADSEPTLVE